MQNAHIIRAANVICESHTIWYWNPNIGSATVSVDVKAPQGIGCWQIPPVYSVTPANQPVGTRSSPHRAVHTHSPPRRSTTKIDLVVSTPKSHGHIHRKAWGGGFVDDGAPNI